MELNLKQLRKEREISQEEMSRRCNVHRNTYALWEAHPEKISVGNAEKIALALYEDVVKIFFNR